MKNVKSLCKNHPDRRSDPRSCCSGRLAQEWCWKLRADTAAASSGTESAASADASNSNKKELKYGKAAGPYTVLFEDAIKPILEKEGYTLTEVDFSDLLQNDLALNDGEIVSM